MREPIIEVKNLTKTYENYNILNRLSFSVHQGDFVAVVGESGSGKTTLLNILFGFTDYNEGSYTLLDERSFTLSKSATHSHVQNNSSHRISLKNLSLKEKQNFRQAFMGYVPQDYGLIDEWNVYDNITLPLLFSKNNAIKKAPAHLRTLFKYMHLDYLDYIHRKAASLSGGEKQRIAIIRALITHPRILIADELTSALDVQMKISILALLQNLRESGLTIIFSTHDPSMIEHCDQVIDLRKNNSF